MSLRVEDRRLDVYKLRPAHQTAKLIERSRFERETQSKSPWYRERASGEKSQFAVCPACDNPIQLIGLYRLPPGVKHPFGKHTTHAVPGLANIDDEAREGCPYFKPRKHNKSDRKQRFEGVPRKVIELLVDQFDRVEYILRRQTGIKFSQRALRHMLRSYDGERGHLYMGATLRNVPWIFAYMSDSTGLYGQVIKNEAMRSAILAHVPNATFDDNHRLLARPDARKRRHFDIAVCFVGHDTVKSEEGQVYETMKMSVSVRWDREIDVESFYEEDIVFEYDFFERLLNLSPERAKKNRDMRLVEIASEILGHWLA